MFSVAEFRSFLTYLVVRWCQVSEEKIHIDNETWDNAYSHFDKYLHIQLPTILHFIFGDHWCRLSSGNPLWLLELQMNTVSGIIVSNCHRIVWHVTCSNFVINDTDDWRWRIREASQQARHCDLVKPDNPLDSVIRCVSFGTLFFNSSSSPGRVEHDHHSCPIFTVLFHAFVTTCTVVCWCSSCVYTHTHARTHTCTCSLTRSHTRMHTHLLFLWLCDWVMLVFICCI